MLYIVAKAFKDLKGLHVSIIWNCWSQKRHRGRCGLKAKPIYHFESQINNFARWGSQGFLSLCLQKFDHLEKCP